MKHPTSLITLFFLLAVSVPFLRAENRDFTIKVEAGTDYLLGYTQYGIGWRFYDVAGTPYLIGFEISRLKFPLNSLMFYANAEMTLFQVIMLSLHFDKNITAAPGKMEDSDWGVWYLQGNTWASPASLDYYSLSDKALNAFSINASLHYVLPLESIFSFSFGLGFIFQYIYCEESNTDQWNPSYQQYSAYLDPSYGDHDYFPQLVGTYRIESISSPWPKPKSACTRGTFSASAFSPGSLPSSSPLTRTTTSSAPNWRTATAGAWGYVPA